LHGPATSTVCRQGPFKAGRGPVRRLRPHLVQRGGSSFYDLIAEVPQRLRLSKPLQVVICSGCYLTHDSGLYWGLLADLRRPSDIARATDLSFQPALEVWRHVVSIPEPNRIFLDAG